MLHPRFLVGMDIEKSLFLSGKLSQNDIPNSLVRLLKRIMEIFLYNCIELEELYLVIISKIKKKLNITIILLKC